MSSPIEEAIRLLQSVAARRPNDLNIRERLLAACVLAGWFGEAVGEFRSLVSQCPEQTQFHYDAMVKAIRQPSHFIGLCDAFRDAAGRDESPTLTWYGLGLACQVVRDEDSAMAAYQQCIATDPSFAVAYYNLANAMLVKGDHTKAQSYCEQAIAISPVLAEPHMLLGSIYMRQRRRDDSVAQYREFLRLAQPYLSKYAAQAKSMIQLLTGDFMP